MVLQNRLRQRCWVCSSAADHQQKKVGLPGFSRSERIDRAGAGIDVATTFGETFVVLGPVLETDDFAAFAAVHVRRSAMGALGIANFDAGFAVVSGEAVFGRSVAAPT